MVQIYKRKYKHFKKESTEQKTWLGYNISKHIAMEKCRKFKITFHRWNTMCAFTSQSIQYSSPPSPAIDARPFGEKA